MNIFINILRVIIGLLLLPGLIFDLIIGSAIILNSNSIGNWLFNNFNLHLYNWMKVITIIGAFLLSLPVGLLYFGIILLIGYCIIQTGIFIVSFPFLGLIKK